MYYLTINVAVIDRMSVGCGQMLKYLWALSLSMGGRVLDCVSVCVCVRAICIIIPTLYITHPYIPHIQYQSRHLILS